MPPKYKTIRLKEHDYQKMKEVQKLLRRKGLDSIDWGELKRQDLIEVDDEGDDEDDGEEFTWGFLIGLGAAALAYFLSKKQQQEGR